MEISKKDLEVLRRLASEYMEAASLPVHRQKMELWKALNRSGMQRPMVTIEQLPWHELNGDGELTLQVSDPYWRGFEELLRRKLYQWRHFPVDMVLEPYLTIPLSVKGMGDYSVVPEEEKIVTYENETASSHSYKQQIKDMEDIEKIKDMEIVYDAKENEARLAQAELIFGGIAPVKLQHGMQFHLGVWDRLSEFMSVEQVYYDIYDRPEFLHAAMERITEATLSGIRQLNELGLHNDIAPDCHCSYIYTDELLPDFGEGKGSVSQNCWAFGLAQLFTSASPEVTEEFELPYISRMAKEFGMIYYGCCERLDDRLEIVKKIPNVRKISCSPWSDRETFAEKIGKEIIMSNKPTPALLAVDHFDPDAVRKDLEYTVRCAKENGANLELLLKDISTVRFQPERLTEWAEVAMKVVENY